MLLCHVNYFELKAIETLQAHEKVLFLKEFNLRALPIIRVISRNKILWPICRAGQTSNYWASVLLIILWMAYVWLSSSEASRYLTSSLAQKIINISFSLSVLNVSCMWGLWHMYVIKVGYFLLLIWSVSCRFNY